MGKSDFSGLKLKVVASLIAIAAVDLLEVYVEIGSTSRTDVLWQIAIPAHLCHLGRATRLDGPARRIA